MMRIFIVSCVVVTNLLLPLTGCDEEASMSPDPDPPGADATPPAPPDAGVMLPPPVSWSADIMPILLSRCGGCHLKDEMGSGGLSLGVQGQLAYQALIDQDTVLDDPDCGGLMRVNSQDGDPMQSSLYLKLIGDTCGKRMPAGMMAVPLSPDQIELFARWIEEGASDD